MKAYFRCAGGGIELTATFGAQAPQIEPVRKVTKLVDRGGDAGFAMPDYRNALSRFERTDDLVEALLDVLFRTTAAR